MGNVISEINLNIPGWDQLMDLGMITIPSLNNLSRNPQRKHFILIRCQKCGYESKRELGNLKSRLIQKGGNLRCANCASMGNHILKYTYKNMLARCYNTKVKSYDSHGGKGIRVCEEWLHNPQSFYLWAINHGWEIGLYLDREFNDRDYTPENCRWVTPSDSCYNRDIFKGQSTGHKYISVYKNPRSSKIRFQVRVRKHRLGYFDTLEQAIKAKNKYIQSKY